MMGCNTSKVSKTHVEIIRIKQEIKSSVKWWKKKKQESKDGPKRGLGNDGLTGCPSNSPQSSSDELSKGLDRRPSTDMVAEKQTAISEGCVSLNKRHQSTESMESCENFLLAASVGSDEGKSFTGLSDSRPPSGRKSRMTNDLTVEEVENSDLSDEMEQRTRPTTRTSTPTVGYHVPLIVHSAWSDFSVRQKKKFSVNKTNVKKFRDSAGGNAERSSCTNRRIRPMAAKGERQQPGLTEVYNAELSIPGTPVPNPKRQQEEGCLNAWMARRLGDEY